VHLPTRRVLMFASLLLPGVASLAQAPPEPAAPSEAQRPVNASSLESAPRPTGYESDLYCFGYLGGYSDSFVAEVSGAEDVAEQVDFVSGDYLYLSAGADRNLRAGDEYWLVTPEDEVLNPISGKGIGRFYRYRGRGVIHSLGGHSAIFHVTQACTDIPMGAYLKKFDPIPIPLARKTPPAVPGDPPSGKVQGHIVFSRDGVVALGQDTDVIVDLGIANGIQPGDFLTIYRYSTGREYGIKPLGTYWVTVPPPPGVEIPRTYLGEVAILEVGDRWAIGRITDAYRLVEVGDEVELK
jgi:hypothetical protein